MDEFNEAFTSFCTVNPNLTYTHTQTRTVLVQYLPPDTMYLLLKQPQAPGR